YRSAQDFLLIWLAVGVPHLVALYREAGPRRVPRSLWRLERSTKRTLSAPAFRFQPGWVAGLLLLLGVVSLSNVVPRPHGVGWPVAAVGFMERERLKGNCFAHPHMGAYLVWRLGPERVRCHADTRGFFFPPEVLEDGVAILRMEGDWEERLRRVLNRGTDWFLLPVQGPDSVLWQALRQEVKP